MKNATGNEFCSGNVFVSKNKKMNILNMSAKKDMKLYE